MAKSEKTVIINDENIQKAFDVLELNAEEDSNPFLKGNQDPEDDEEDIDIDEDIDEDNDEDNDEEEENDEEVEKAKKAKILKNKKAKMAKISKENEEDIEDEDIDEDDEVDEDNEDDEDIEEGKAKKAKKVIKPKKVDKTNNPLEKGFINSLEKGLNLMNDKFKALGELQKASLEMIEELQNRINTLEKTPMERKSLISSHPIEKSFDSLNEELEGKKVFSISKNRKEIVELLKDKANIDSDTPDKKWAEALLLFESSNQIEKSIQNELFQKEEIIISK